MPSDLKLGVAHERIYNAFIFFTSLFLLSSNEKEGKRKKKSFGAVYSLRDANSEASERVWKMTYSGVKMGQDLEELGGTPTHQNSRARTTSPFSEEEFVVLTLKSNRS